MEPPQGQRFPQLTVWMIKTQSWRYMKIFFKKRVALIGTLKLHQRTMLWNSSFNSSCSLEKASKVCERNVSHGIRIVKGQQQALRVYLFKSLSRFLVEASCWRWCSGNTSDVWDERVLLPSITRNSRMTNCFRRTRFWLRSVRTCLNCLDVCATHRFLSFFEQTGIKASGGRN